MTALPPEPGISAFRSASTSTVQRLLSGSLPLAPGELLVFLSLGANLPLHLPNSPAQPPAITLIQALHALHPTCPVIALSSLWRTQPVDFPGTQPGTQIPATPPPPDFFNACALLRPRFPVELPVEHALEQLLALTQQLEQRFGRIRPAPPDPLQPETHQTPNSTFNQTPTRTLNQTLNRTLDRTLDIDLLLALAASPSGWPTPILRSTPTLQLPHPSMHRRRFVLAPLAEIAPTLQHPLLLQSIAELLHALGPITPASVDAVTWIHPPNGPPEWPALPPAI